MYYVSVWCDNSEAHEEQFANKKEAIRYCREQVTAGFENQEKGIVQNKAGETLARYVNENGKAVKLNP